MQASLALPMVSRVLGLPCMVSELHRTNQLYVLAFGSQHQVQLY